MAGRDRAAGPNAAPGRPIAWHLGLLCGALLLPMLALEAYLLLRIAGAERAGRQDAARDAARHLATSLDHGLTTLQAVAEVLASSDHLLSGDLAAFRERLRRLPGVAGAVLLLRQGAAAQALAGTLPPGAARDPQAEATARATGRPQVTGLLETPGGAPAFAILAPVPGRPDQLLSLRLGLADLAGLLQDEALPAGMVATLTDRSGRILARSRDAARFVGLLRPNAAEGPPPGLGWRRSLDGDGVEVLVAHAEAAVSGWTAWVFLPRAAFAAPLRQRLWMAAGIAVLLAGLAAALALAFARRIVRPMHALAAAASLPGQDMPPLASQVREVAAVADALATARRDAAARLRESEEMLAALDLAQVQVVTPEGRILLWTTGMQHLFGWTPAQATGRLTQALLDSAFPEPMPQIQARLLATGGWQGEIRQRHRDGRQLLVASHWSLRLGPGGVPVAVVQASTDITALREAENRLRDTQAELRHVARLADMSALATTLTHEISQPLTASVSFTEAALRLLAAETPAAGDLAAARAAMREAADQGVHAGAILRRLRDFIGGSEGEREAADLNALVGDAASLALGGARQHGITLRLEPAPRALPALVDPVQIRQVVVNLVRNAIEATEHQPQREVVLRLHGAADQPGPHLVEVADSGPGLAPEIGTRLFQPFVTTKRDGMGVGLAISRAIVEEHGGRLGCRPNPGGGTVFHFTIPALQAPPHAGEETRDAA
ncbi:ATP-binding protein [Falsiroseomonas selenitidurans]|uniref:histidine kinase n=1 Tax=Falsiroseomonas selenitidurans TaxID=2716335 RepID=A0ABX1DX39_9PROT|nr:ATP-binding protein [Falsiroseomonas selenitidurans]NKC29477.1 PAS domain S-box protein [Falsiroseomonas selenitidurans]